VATFENALLALNRLQIGDPVYFSCVLIGVRGMRLSRDGLSFYHTDLLFTFDHPTKAGASATRDAKKKPPRHRAAHVDRLIPIQIDYGVPVSTVAKLEQMIPFEVVVSVERIPTVPAGDRPG
jgi:hypothetical protein